MGAPSRPFPTSLGDLVAASIEARACHGPGDVYGQAVRLTGDEHAFLDAAYAIDPATGRRQVDTAIYSRRKGLRKSELCAWVVAEETTGPTRAYWDGGRPVARAPLDPLVLCAATTENQGELVYGAFRAIVAASAALAPLYDVGLLTTQLVGAAGRVALIQTRNPVALDGERPTCEVADELHLWHSLALVEAWRTLTGNLKKRYDAQPWLLAPTTAYAPGRGSIAELLHKASTATPAQPRLVYDHLEADAAHDLDDPAGLRAAIVQAAGDARWPDTEGIATVYTDPTWPRERFRQLWLNQPVGAADQWTTPNAWAQLADPTRPLAAGDTVALGFDGSDYDDATALVAVRLSDAHAQILGLWQRPSGAAGQGWSVPRAAVERVVRATHARFRVVRALADPPGWRDEIGRWSAEHGGTWREFRTAVPTLMGPAIERATTAIRSGQTSHDGSPRLAAHVIGARLVEDRGHQRLVKRDPRTDKIDAAVAWVIAHEARGRALAGGATDTPPPEREAYAFAAW